MEPGHTILIVDDVPMFRDLEGLILARTGKILMAEDGLQALEIASREKPSLVLTDLLMPRMDGAELCAALKQDPELRDIPVLVLTASEHASDHARAVYAGADDVLPKPISRVALVEAAQRFLRFDRPRGLPRVSLRSPVRIQSATGDAWGTVRNVSRAGVFVESDLPFAPAAEVALDFTLPEAERQFSPTARVIWCRGGSVPGAGLRFVGLDAPSARFLQDYVHERASASGRAPLAEGA